MGLLEGEGVGAELGLGLEFGEGNIDGVAVGVAEGLDEGDGD